MTAPISPSRSESKCHCGRFPEPHEKQDLCGIGFNEFLGEVQHRLIKAGYNPPAWPQPAIRDQGDLDEALDSCTQWCMDRLDTPTPDPRAPTQVLEWIWHMDLHLTEHDLQHAGKALRAAWPHVRKYLVEVSERMAFSAPSETALTVVKLEGKPVAAPCAIEEQCQYGRDRNAIIEECAAVCDRLEPTGAHAEAIEATLECARALRALKNAAPQGTAVEGQQQQSNAGNQPSAEGRVTASPPACAAPSVVASTEHRVKAGVIHRTRDGLLHFIPEDTFGIGLHEVVEVFSAPSSLGKPA